MRFSALLLLGFFALQGGRDAKAFPDASDLKLVITIEQPAITAPFPARVTLHLHNSGKSTLWLYRPASPQEQVAGQVAPDESQTVSAAPSCPVGSSTLGIQLKPAESRVLSPGNSAVLDSAGLPHPKMIRVAAGDDYEEKSVIHLAPAWAESNGEKQPIWGRYTLAATYAAKYSNGKELERILGLTLWQGAIQSNSLEIELQPPPPIASGSLGGTITGPDNAPRSGVLVSLSDKEERLLDQTRTDFDGKYSFTHLAPGWYWATVRRTDFTEDTTIFRHAILSAAEPTGTIDFLLTPPETYLPRQMLHKPVLFHVTDGAGAGLGNVSLEITWSSGTVTDDERMDVATGPGIDGFKMVDDCAKK